MYFSVATQRRTSEYPLNHCYCFCSDTIIIISVYSQGTHGLKIYISIWYKWHRPQTTPGWIENWLGALAQGYATWPNLSCYKWLSLLTTLALVSKKEHVLCSSGAVITILYTECILLLMNEAFYISSKMHPTKEILITVPVLQRTCSEHAMIIVKYSRG